MTNAVADLVIVNARCVATMDGARREISGGWVAIIDGLISAVGDGPAPEATKTIDATDCLVTPGLINTHHHLYQNLTRAFPAMTDKPLFGWLQSLYPLWRAIDTESVHVSAWVGLAELALSGCTTSSDHLYLHPHGAGDLLTAEIEAAQDLGIRFHPTRGSMSLSEKDGGLPPDDVVADDDEILAASEAAVLRHHDRSHGAMTRVALAPCSPFSVTEDLMVRSAELAERLDVRLHTHFAENAEDDAAQRAQGERHGEHGEGLQQRQGWIARREEQRGDGHGEKTVDGEVEPLDEVADGRGGDHLVQGGWADLLACVDSIHATLLIPDLDGFRQVTER